MIRISKIRGNILGENSKLQDVLNILNKKEHKICIVSNKKKIPLGIFTDEDIRRKLIKKNSMNSPVKGNYNKNFIEKCLDDTKELCERGDKWKYFFKKKN